MGIKLHLSILAALLAVCSCDVFSCDGFVKSAVPVDFSKLSIKLLTTEGNLKHEEDVNPQNGYFMVPVYNKGNYVLRVSSPEGYFFEPNEIELKIDGVNDACSKHEDLIFTLNGFSVKGVVDGAGAGLTLNLQQNGKIVHSSVTTDGGVYNFRALPGSYEVITGASASECISRGSAVVKVENGPVVVSPNLKVSGYQLKVKATSGGSPLSNVKIELLTDNKKIELENCSNGVCALGQTTSSGSVVVPCVPTGSYRIRASFANKQSTVQFTPEVLKINVVDGKVEGTFTATSVSTKGRVINGNTGLAGVSVLVNGKKVATTDNQGNYQLSGLKPGAITVTAEADQTTFSTAKSDVKFLSTEVSDIVVHKFSICGSIEQDSNGNFPELVVKNKKNSKSLEIRTSTGSFCTELTPGVYTIGPQDATSSLTPRQLDVNLETKPVTGLKFTHFKTSAQVRASCIGACPTSTVSLLLGDTVIQKVEGTDVFNFENVGPGHYKARIDDQNRGCWEKQEVDLVVERTKPQPAQLVQNGFTARIKLSHPAKLTWTHTEKSQLTGVLGPKDGINSICVPLHGKYSVKIESCYQFAKPSFEITVPSFTVHEEAALAVRISGKVESNEKSDAVIKIRSSSGTTREVTVQPNGEFTFHEPLTSVGETLTLVPHSTKFLFEPTSAPIRVSSECNDKAIVYNAFKGIYIDGTVKPAVGDVQISAVLKTDESVVLETKTDAKGNYRLGPVKKIEDFTFSAQLDGYKFVPGNKAGAFESIKLSHLSIKIVDEADGQPLDGVLLSVVGGDFRSNNVLDATATANFVDLAPGDYFVRPILQEYKFATPLTTIKVTQGRHENLVLKGKRVLYSAFGKVRQMSGSGVSEVPVEAVSAGCDKQQSEATTSHDGSFRIRGLHPGCEYKIYTKESEDSSETSHSFPNEFTVKMTAEDVKDLEFIAIPMKQTTEAAIEIESTIRDLQSVRVTVSSGTEQLRSSVVHQPVNLFYVSGLPRDGREYLVRVEADKPPQAFTAVTKMFTADAPVRIVRVPVREVKKTTELELTWSTLLGFPLLFIIGFLFLQRSVIFDWIDRLIQKSGVFNDRKRRK